MFRLSETLAVDKKIIRDVNYIWLNNHEYDEHYILYDPKRLYTSDYRRWAAGCWWSRWSPSAPCTQWSEPWTIWHIVSPLYCVLFLHCSKMLTKYSGHPVHTVSDAGHTCTQIGIMVIKKPCFFLKKRNLLFWRVGAWQKIPL